MAQSIAIAFIRKLKLTFEMI